MNRNRSQLYIQRYIYKQTPNNLILIINDGVSKGRPLASSVVASVPSVAFIALCPFCQLRQLRQLCCVCYVRSVAYVACVALGGNPASIAPGVRSLPIETAFWPLKIVPWETFRRPIVQRDTSRFHLCRGPSYTQGSGLGSDPWPSNITATTTA